MNEAWLLLGTNVRSRKDHLKTGIRFIQEHCGNITDYSAVYETEPWGDSDQPWFYNTVIVLETSMTALQLLPVLQEAEQAAGRIMRTKWQARELDVDLLFFNNEVFATPDLSVPHPRIEERRFTLVPLAEINEDKIHPVNGNSIAQLLEACNDPLKVIPSKLRCMDLLK